VTSVSVSGVFKAYGSRPVLTGANLEVEDGALVAILGPSGSGKTTLLRALAGFERVDAGRISLGTVVADDGRRYLPPEERNIGYVPQEGALFPHLSAERNVAFGLSKAERRDGRVAELLEMVGLRGLERRYPHQLSGGQQQRVALARALAVHPGVVLLDEPFDSLDAGLRASVRADVREVLRAADTTAVLVTHDQDEALSFADEVAVLRDGEIAQVASPQELYTRPVDVGVAGFVGQANLIPAMVSDGMARSFLGDLHMAAGPAADGPVMVLVRPEQLRLTAPGADGILGGVVTHQEYYGHDAVVRVRITRSSSKTENGAAPEDPEELVVRTEGYDLPAVGEVVCVHVEGEVIALRSHRLTGGVIG
jgi:iron(III) transport system ATP-binding protein